MQLDESTDVSDTALLEPFVHRVDKDSIITEEINAVVSFKGTAAASDSLKSEFATFN
jgi:hypothetical protein